ncbi:hypothetical protein CfE428DRAFT_5590 [Chthoniobacter flavus Ellin428]|uniref:Uncharacterized protein n=1 Tax=Chthoniobacter flavus Ellin428 TaxID=497964 RepID=B4D9K0_9BACT|nr:hypothetical protein CfE428DRAFT_5590 [Chthoniobacter flavus Ellin428]TCO87838.1 hypothetical protein EV701_120137 [Chthoniobacter flavus]
MVLDRLGGEEISGISSRVRWPEVKVDTIHSSRAKRKRGLRGWSMARHGRSMTTFPRLPSCPNSVWARIQERTRAEREGRPQVARRAEEAEGNNGRPVTGEQRWRSLATPFRMEGVSAGGIPKKPTRSPPPHTMELCPQARAQMSSGTREHRCPYGASIFAHEEEIRRRRREKTAANKPPLRVPIRSSRE